jgi:hypothetical protein
MSRKQIDKTHVFDPVVRHFGGCACDDVVVVVAKCTFLEVRNSKLLCVSMPKAGNTTGPCFQGYDNAWGIYSLFLERHYCFEEHHKLQPLASLERVSPLPIEVWLRLFTDC